MFIKPAPGKKIRYPDSEKFLPADGAEVSDRDLFWVKRLNQGDVFKATPGKARITKADKGGNP